MKSGIDFRQGDIVLVPFPFTDLSATKKRPVLVISKTDYNRKSMDLICCGITSNLRNVSHSILIESRDLSVGTLPKPSRIKVDKIFTLEKSIMIRRFGRVKKNVVEKAKNELYKII